MKTADQTVLGVACFRAFDNLEQNLQLLGFLEKIVWHLQDD